MTKISRGQLRRAHTLWGAYTRRELALGDKREARLRWAGELTGREISTWKDLSAAEAANVIDTLQRSMGIAESSPARRRPRKMSRAAAQSAGTAGRKDHSSELVMASAADLERINDAITRLGWDR